MTDTTTVNPATIDRDAPWRCADCNTRYVVPSLAYDCEKRHRTRDT